MIYKTLIFSLVFSLLGNIAICQNISNELLKAIQEGDREFLNKSISPESLNDCFEIKNSSYNYLTISIKMQQIQSLQFFVDKGANLEGICTEKTPLMYAVKYGQLPMV